MSAPEPAEGAGRSRAEPARLAPWALSAAAHGGLVIAAGFIVWQATRADPDYEPVTASFDAPAFMAPPQTPTLEEEEATEAASTEKAPRPPEPADLRTPAAPLADVSAFDLPAEAAPALEAPPAPSLRRSEAMSTVEFAGLGASDARDIIYVLDASGSMITTMPEAIAELKRSLGALHPMQRFQVFLIRNSAAGGYAWPAVLRGVNRPVLLDATRENKRAVFAWLDDVITGGASDPMPALEAALKMRPDAVFLLSAGIVGLDSADVDPDRILDRLDRLNPADDEGDRRVAIRTIQVIDAGPSGLMERIGRAHGGGDAGYRFISSDEFNRLRRANP